MPRIRTIVFVFLIFCAFGVSGHAEKNLVRPPGTTRYAPMMDRLNSLMRYDESQGLHRMALSSIGQSVRRREIWMVTLHDQSVDIGATKKLFYLCRQHGHEPASTEAALNLVDEIVHADANSELARCLQHVTVYIVPMANPDGAEQFLRHNAHDVDLNRDWILRTQPETRAYYHAIQRIRPDLMTDQHELYPDDTTSDFTETVAPDGGAPLSIAEACESTQQVVQVCMGADGFNTRALEIHDHHISRLAHRFNSIRAGVPTILFETSRLQGTGRTVAMRAAAHERFMKIVLRDLAGEHDELLAEAAAGVAHTGPPVPAAALAAPATGNAAGTGSASTPGVPTPAIDGTVAPAPQAGATGE